MRLTARDLSRVRHRQFLRRERLAGAPVTGISTDTRTIARGSLFVALRGERFDGRTFVAEAFARGAAAAVVAGDFDTAKFPDLPLLVVDDPLVALGELAGFHRQRFSIPVLAIGGSNGKTTTKEMVAAVLRTKYRVLCTQGNLNNQIGVPQTLFGLTGRHDVAVLELGTNHPGEIASLCGIARPTHALITNIGSEHLEFFGDLDGVAREEGALFEALAGTRGGTAIVNADDRRVTRLAARVRHKVMFGFSARGASLHGKKLRLDARGNAAFEMQRSGTRRPVSIALSFPGKHNAQNALAAAAAGVTFGVPARQIAEALHGFQPVSKRMETLVLGGVTVLNDSYNANPDSMAAAVATLAGVRTGGKRIAVLADMKELGQASADAHRRLGDQVSDAGIDCLLTYGDQARLLQEHSRVAFAVHYEQKNMLAEYLAELVAPGDVVLVKGSRGMAMEDVVVFLRQRRPE
jgi:UDP-N-acetylmuramoyl-tripeptide--D-alanyl-D-alanine ligase